MVNSPIEFPANPERIPEKIRKGEEMDFEDLCRIMDRRRRNEEFMNGSVDQEDASSSGAVTVPAGTTTTITITPEENTNFYLHEVGINPDADGVNWTLKADNIQTDSNNLFFENPFTVRKKIEIVAENTTASEKNLDYYTNARAVEVR